jgi:hypothetical protein
MTFLWLPDSGPWPYYTINALPRHTKEKCLHRSPAGAGGFEPGKSIMNHDRHEPVGYDRYQCPWGLDQYRLSPGIDPLAPGAVYTGPEEWSPSTGIAHKTR